MVIQWSVKSPSSVCLLLISILVIYVIYFPFLVSWSLVLVPSVIGLRSLCTSAAAACLLLLLIDEPWCCRVDYAMLPCPDLGVLPTCTWSIRLALGCPTLRSGTWFPNTSTWYLVGTRLPNILSWHMCPTRVPVNLVVHIIRSRQTSFILAVILCDDYYLYDIVCYLVTTCDALWTYHTSCTWFGWTVCIFHQRYPLHSTLINLTSFFYVHCYRLDVSSLAHLLIWTSPCSIPRIHRLYVICQHHVYVMTLQYYMLKF